MLSLFLVCFEMCPLPGACIEVLWDTVLYDVISNMQNEGHFNCVVAHSLVPGATNLNRKA
jgi:hypothetical protein